MITTYIKMKKVKILVNCAKMGSVHRLVVPSALKNATAHLALTKIQMADALIVHLVSNVMVVQLQHANVIVRQMVAPSFRLANGIIAQ
jgi:hypothetical protein